MKAIHVHQLGNPEVMRLEEVPDLKPARGEILVRVKAAGVNPVDTYIRSGGYAAKPDLPYTPGADAAGIVEALGPGVDGLRAGERVYVEGGISGAYAEQVVRARNHVHPLPDRVSFSQGAALGVPYATAFRALFHCGRAIASETLLVHGASGGVGIAAVQLGRAAGLNVMGTAGTEKGRTLVLAEGAHHALDHRAAGYLKELMDLTDGRGVDVILEMLANLNLGKDLGVLAKHGRAVVVGSRGPVEINPRDAMARDASVIGMTLFNVSEPELTSIHAALVAGLENGSLRPVIGQEIPLADAARAHHAVMEPGSYGKIVLIP